VEHYPDILKQTDLFAGIPEETLLQDILPHGIAKEYKKGNYIIMPQQKVDHFGIVLSGSIHILHLFSDGSYSLMSVCQKGSTLGTDLICTRSQIAPYHAMAASSTQVLYFPAELITQYGMLREDHRTVMMQNLLALVCKENMKKEYRLAILARKGLRERIETYLTMQASRRQTQTFTIPFSREELAAFLCVNRSTLSHELSKMQQEGLISFRKNEFTLHMNITNHIE